VGNCRADSGNVRRISAAHCVSFVHCENTQSGQGLPHDLEDLHNGLKVKCEGAKCLHHHLCGSLSSPHRWAAHRVYWRTAGRHSCKCSKQATELLLLTPRRGPSAHR